MDDTVVAALIGAASSVVVAFIGKETSHGARLEAHAVPGRQLPTRAWVITLVLLAVWLLVSPGAIHHDFSGTNFLFIPVVLLLLAAVRPIRPLTAAWVSLAIFSSNFILGPFGNRIAGSQYDTTVGVSLGKLWPILGIGFGTAALVAGVCALRLRQRRPDPPTEVSIVRTSDAETRATDDGFTTALERLAALHAGGKLSDDEFRVAKRRLLGGP